MQTPPKPVQTIEIFGTESCTKCESVKQYLHSSHVLFVYHDIMKDREQMKRVLDMNVMSMPVIAVNGCLYDTGFNVDKLDKLIEEDM